MWTDEIFAERGLHFVTLHHLATVSSDAEPAVLEPEKCDGWGWYRWSALPQPLTKRIHASRSAAADLGHALACGYARGSGAGLAVAGPGSLPGPQRGRGAGRSGRDVTSGVRAC